LYRRRQKAAALKAIQAAASIAWVVITVSVAANERQQPASPAIFTAAPLSIFHHWAVSTANSSQGGSPHVVFTLIGSGEMPKLPIIILSYRDQVWNALLTCGENLEGRVPQLVFQWDEGRRDTVSWKATHDRRGAFAIDPRPFILRMLKSRSLTVEFPVPGKPRRALFDTSGLSDEIDKFPAAKKSLTPKAKDGSGLVLAIGRKPTY